MVFSSKGTKYFTLTSLSKIRPFIAFEPMVNLKYDLWEQGIDFEYFHATEDNIKTRYEVFEIISKNLSKFVVDSVIIEKCKTNPSLQDPHKFYQKSFEFLLDYILDRFKGKFSSIIIITDSIPVKKKRNEIKKALKSYLGKWSNKEKIPYRIYHYSSKSDLNLQIVDYFNWAIFRKWERDDVENFDLIKDSIYSEFNVFKIGTNRYY